MRYRHRAKGTKPYTQDIEFWCELHSQFMPAQNTSYVEPSKASLMSDLLGHAFWNPCDHRRFRFYGGSIGSLNCDGGITLPGHTRFHSYGHHRCTVSDASAVLDLLDQQSSDSHLDDWLSDLYLEFTDQFDAKYSIANTLIELRGGIKEVLPEIKDLRRSLGANYLKLQFGIKPFLKDIKDTVNVYGRFKSRLSFLKKTNRITFPVRKQLPISWIPEGDWFVLNTYDPTGPPQDWECDSTGGGPPPPPFPIGERAVREGPLPPDPVQPHVLVHHPVRTEFLASSLTGTWRALGMVTNQLRGLDNLGRQVDAMAHCAGLANPVKIAWNAIPWTWLADWFVDTDQILDPMEGQPFQGKLVLDRCYLSQKLKAQGEVGSICDSSSEHPNLNETPGELQLILYRRTEEVEIEESLISPRLIRPSLTGSQSAILLALVQTRTRAIPDVARFLRHWRRLGH